MSSSSSPDATPEPGRQAAIPRGLAEVSLLGGPLHRTGQALGLVRGHSDTRPLGVAIGLFLWLLAIVLALVEGRLDRVFSLDVIGGHARLLIALPLLFFCEARFDPHVRRFIHTLVASRIVAGTELTRLGADIARITRLKDSWLAEFAVLAIAASYFLVASFLAASSIGLPGPTAATGVEGMGTAGDWYFLVCLTIFRFLILRWVWRLGLWWFLLWRIGSLDLRLVPTHPDRVGGLGYFGIAQESFVTLAGVISVVIAAAFAEDLATGAIQLAEVYPAIAFILLIDGLLFITPFYAFFPKLRATREQGLAAYMELASHHASAFDAKWIQRPGADSGGLLGTGDLQSLSGLGNSVRAVQEMKLAPLGHQILTRYVLWAIAPFLPLLLFAYPINELAVRFAKTLLGV